MDIVTNDLLQALAYAAEKHKYQRRAGYEPLPYLNHLVKVTHALVQIGRETDRDLLIAAVLHDVVEDTDATVEELREHFGSPVAETVAELTDDMNLPYAERKALQVERAGALSDPAKKIRIADKASNLQDIFSYPLDWKESKKKTYLENAIAVVDLIRGVNQQLEAWFDETVAFAREKLSSTV